jgi:hypothetical protein
VALGIVRRVGWFITPRTRSEIRYDVPHRDRRYLDAAIDLALREWWLTCEETYWSTGRLRSRRYSVGPIEPRKSPESLQTPDA